MVILDHNCFDGRVHWLLRLLVYERSAKIHGQMLLLVEVFIGILIASLPFLIEKLGNFYFPQIELVFFYIFLYMSIFLGSGLQFYGVTFWDKYEHVLSA